MAIVGSCLKELFIINVYLKTNRLLQKESGDYYFWGRIGDFCSWAPRKITIPGTGPLHSIYLGDNSCIIQKGAQLYCMNVSGGSKELEDLSISKMLGFDGIKHGVIVNIDCDSRKTIMSNHRGQLIISTEEDITFQSSFHLIGRLGFVEALGCTTRGFSILCDIPLLMQSVERNVLLQPGNYSVPRIIIDVANYFSGECSFYYTTNPNSNF